MKTLKLITAGIVLLLSNLTQAQVNVNLNVGTAPDWGPAGYDTVEYYYIPDVESYYDVRHKQFIYYERGTWVRARHLPQHYRGYDLYNGYKVVLNDYHGATPYVHFHDHKVKYHKGYKHGPQKTIGVKKIKHGKGKKH